MAIYLIDYENVYIAGLDGLENLTKDDQVILIYTQNRAGLNFDLHMRLNACKADLRIMEVTALSSKKNTVKNALDLQLSMYVGYLVGQHPHVPIYIISQDTDFYLILNFFSQYLQNEDTSLSVCASIDDALHGIVAMNTVQLLQEMEAEEAAAKREKEVEATEVTEAESTQQSKPVPTTAAAAKPTANTSTSTKPKRTSSAEVFPKALQKSVRELLETQDQKEINRICAILTAANDLVALNNLLSRYYRDGAKVKQVYHKLKPNYAELRQLALSNSQAQRKKKK